MMISAGNGLSSEIIYQPKRTGRFYLDVQDATDRYDGHYKISVAEAVDDFRSKVSILLTQLKMLMILKLMEG